MSTTRFRRNSLSALPLSPALRNAVLRSYRAVSPERWPRIRRRLAKELREGLQQ